MQRRRKTRERTHDNRSRAVSPGWPVTRWHVKREASRSPPLPPPIPCIFIRGSIERAGHDNVVDVYRDREAVFREESRDFTETSVHFPFIPSCISDHEYNHLRLYPARPNSLNVCRFVSISLRLFHLCHGSCKRINVDRDYYSRQTAGTITFLPRNFWFQRVYHIFFCLWTLVWNVYS